MLESFKTVLDNEREAEKIQQEAKELAEKLRKEAQEKAEEIYRTTYQEIIDQAKNESIKIKDTAKIDAERETQIFLKRAKKQKIKISKEIEQKFIEAVNAVLGEILT